ncbi:MAG: hypothetical protein AABX72_01330, partial [Nanoarchaeota archaeon]
EIYANCRQDCSANPIIAYQDIYPNIIDLRTAWCDNDACGEATFATLGSGIYTGHRLAVTRSIDNLPVIVFTDDPGELKVIKCGSPDCTTNNVLSRLGYGGGWKIAIDIGSDGLPVIVYSGSPYQLKVAKCLDQQCTAKKLTTVDETWDVNEDFFGIDLAVGQDGFPIISYQDHSVPRRIKFMKCRSLDCKLKNIKVITQQLNLDPSDTAVTIGSDGLPLIVYTSYNNLRVTKCTTADCSMSFTTPLQSTDRAEYLSIIVGHDDLPLISYYDENNQDLKVIKCGSPDCTTGNIITTLASAGDVGSHSSLTLSEDFLPILAYRDETNDDLRVIKCGNNACNAGNIFINLIDLGTSPYGSMMIAT